MAKFTCYRLMPMFFKKVKIPIFLFLFLLSSKSFSQTETVPTPWFENFEAGGYVPGGWGTYPGMVIPFHVGEDPGLSFPTHEGNFISTFFVNLDGQFNFGDFNTINVGPILQGQKFSFKYKHMNDSSLPQQGPGDGTGNTDVYISTNYGTTYTHVLNLQNTFSLDWQYVEIDLANYVGETIKIKIEHTLIDDPSIPMMSRFYYVGFDNFSIASCSPPSSYEQTAQELNSVELTIGSNPNESYEIEYGLPGFTIGSGTVLPPSTSNEISISGLQSSQEYQFYVKKICGTESSAKLGPYKFYTSCQIYESIYEEFQGFPYCWTRHNLVQTLDTGVGNYWYATLQWRMNQEIEVPYLISPQTDQLGNGTKRLRFYARTPLPSIWNQTVPSTLIVGTMSNPDDISTFTPIPGANILIEQSANFGEYVVNLPAGTNNYFAFKLGDEALNELIHIDKVYYELIPLCDPVTENSLIAENITPTQAQLSWDVESDINNFDIEYGPQGFTIGTGTLIQNVTNDYLLTDLNINTNYSYYVRSHCPGENYGNFIGPYNFRTQHLVATPWVETFPTTTIPEGWESVGFNYFGTNPAIGISQTNYLLSTHYSTSPYEYIAETLNIGPILLGDKLSFEYKLANISTPYAPPGVNSGNLYVYISVDYGQTYNLYTTIPNNAISGWQKFETDLVNYLGQTIRIKIIPETVSEEGDNYSFMFAADKFYIGPCTLAPNPTINESTETSVTLNIPGEASNSYQIEYGLVGFTQGTGTLTPVFTGNQYTISDLVHSTVYEYYIKRICHDSQSSFIGKYKFTTQCGIFDQVNENFDGELLGNIFTDTLPLCWTFIDTANSATGFVTPLAGSGDAFQVYNSSSTNGKVILVSPETVNVGNGYKRIRFNAQKPNDLFSMIQNYEITVGTLSNNLDPETFTPVETLQISTSFQEYIVYLPVTSDDYFGFKFNLYHSNQKFHIDDIILENIPDCVPPFNLNVDKNYEDMSAILKWQSPEVVTSHNFIVEWGEAGFTLGTGTQVSLTTHQLEITDLEEDGIYSFYVKRVCDNDSTSFVGPFSFDMQYCIPGFVANQYLFNVNIAGLDFPVTVYDEVVYEQHTETNIVLEVGEPLSLQVDYNFEFIENYNLFGYTYVFVDLNRNGVFDDESELFHHQMHTGDSIASYVGEFVLTGEYLPGNYNVRFIWSEDPILPISACTEAWFGYTIDLDIFINFPCDPPAVIELVEKDFTSVTLNWQENVPSTPYDIEYGVAGFELGTGIMINDVLPPYTIEELVPGTEYVFYIKKECNIENEIWSDPLNIYIECDTPTPTGDAVQTLYLNEDNLAVLQINGENLKFYTDSSMTNEVPSSTMASQTTYYVTQTINCESEDYLAVTINILERIAMPIVNVTQSFCDGTTLNQIVVSGISGAQINWYDSPTSENILPNNTQLETGVYYVSQTDGITTSFRVAVNVTVNYTPPNLQTQTVYICGTSNFASITTNNQLGASVRWYLSETSTEPFSSGILVETGTYYVTQSVGDCESERVPFHINQQQSVNAPNASMQVFCGAALVSDLIVEGIPNATIDWYSSENSINPLAPSTPLVTGTYYVSQTLNFCTSPRRAVAVRMVSMTPPNVAPFVICNSGTISDLIIPAETGVTFNWYISPSSTDILPQSTPLVSGTYFVSRVQYGCESLRTPVSVSIESIPNQPTGDAYQTFMQGATISNLILNQPNVLWYITHSDALSGTNPLSPNMPLVNGTTYYAVIIGTNGCPSLPFAVTVDVYLSNDKFELDKLKYYPNPVEDILNIEYVDILEIVNVYDLQGKLIVTRNFDTSKVELDLNNLSVGTYIIQLKTNNKSQFIKVIKK